MSTIHELSSKSKEYPSYITPFSFNTFVTISLHFHTEVSLSMWVI